MSSKRDDATEDVPQNRGDGGSSSSLPRRQKEVSGVHNHVVQPMSGKSRKAARRVVCQLVLDVGRRRKLIYCKHPASHCLPDGTRLCTQHWKFWLAGEKKRG